MLSRTARLAAVLTIAQSSILMAAPASPPIRFACGDAGVHECCAENSGACPYCSIILCCTFDGQPRNGDFPAHDCYCEAAM